MGWQPIETAPKLGEILLYLPRGVVTIGYWNDTKYHKNPKPYWSSDYERKAGTLNARNNQPTHWQSLPEPPKE